MQTKINWFEIPATNFERAVDFYQTVFDTKLKVEMFGPNQLGVFTGPDGTSVGGVVKGENYEPGGNGAVNYMDAGPSIDAVLGRIEAAGGAIKIGKLALPEDMGFVAYFIDTEGNRLALHSMA